ncbi:DMT family transporter [Sinorhizobium mexicanum]|uniref:DMT family transporter n=1 Tax=Sinorhizobium mexicanum TaxID=375549 RepID=A0A859QS85_9HYPH|nr:DMT family transporter [Sinorhizobium mexicanum]QLL66205.1 DMT family transporter [Sinorhizobium mexicanum]
MFLLALMWGLSIPITKLGLGTIPPMTFTALRFMVAVPLFMFLARRELRVPRKAIPSIIGLGVMGITLGNVAQSFGVQGTSASVATILSATIPVFMVILAAVRFKQAVTRLQWGGLVAAFFGIALVAVGSGSGVDDMSKTTVAGVVWMLVSAVGIASYYIWSAELTEKYGLMPVAAWNMLVGLLTVLPMAGWEMTRQPVEITVEAFAAITYLGVMVTVVGLILWLYLLRAVPARVAASVQYLQPVFGITASAFLFGDKLGLMFAAGVALVLAGLGLAASGKRADSSSA